MQSISRLMTLALLAPLSACSDAVTESYATWEDARRAGSIERGWLPAFVPSSAYEIRDTHDVDTNAQTLTFKVPATDVDTLVSRLPRVPTDRFNASRVAKRLGWTPAEARHVEVYGFCSEARSVALFVHRAGGRAALRAPMDTGLGCS
jgi:hypothetical protein